MEMFLVFWQSWPVFVTALVTLGVTIYAFLPNHNQKSPTATMVYQVITVMAFILALPAVLIHPDLNLELFDVNETIERAVLWLNIIGGIVALFSFLLSILGVGKERLAPIPQRFSQVPIGPLSGVGVAVPPTPAAQGATVGVNPAGQGVGGIGQSALGQQPSFGRIAPPTARSNTVGGNQPTEQTSEVGTIADGSTAYGGGTQQASTPFSAAPSPSATIGEPESDVTVLLRPKNNAQYFAWLVELHGPRRGTAHPLTRTRNRIGRGKDSHVRLQDKSVSSEHAILLRDEERNVFVLQDLASANGTYLHGQPVYQPQPVKDQDRIKFGANELHFMEIRPDELFPDENKAQNKTAKTAVEPVSLSKKAIDTVVLSPGAVDDS